MDKGLTPAPRICIIHSQNPLYFLFLTFGLERRTETQTVPQRDPHSRLLHVLLGKLLGPTVSGESRGLERILFFPNFFTMSTY